MKIIKYTDFIKEELNDTPEQYVDVALHQLKRKIDKMFEESETSDQSDEESPKKNKSIKQAKEDSREDTGVSFKDLGLRLESSEISKYPAMNDSLTIKFSDDNSTYNLLLSINIKDAIPKDLTADFSYKDIKKIYVKFKKYDIKTFEVIGQLTKNVDMDDIDEEFIVNLKIELDEMFGDDESEEFKIETE